MKDTITALIMCSAGLFSSNVMADLYAEQQKMNSECQAKINMKQQDGETHVESRVRISQAIVACAEKTRATLQAATPKTFDVVDVSDTVSLKTFYPVEISNNVLLSQTILVSPTKEDGVFRWIINAADKSSYLIFGDGFCNDHGEDISINDTLVRFAVTYGTVTGIGNVCYGYPFSREGESYVSNAVYSNEAIKVDGIIFSMKGLSEFSYKPAL